MHPNKKLGADSPKKKKEKILTKGKAKYGREKKGVEKNHRRSGGASRKRS